MKYLEDHIGEISRAIDITDKKYNITISVYDDAPFEKLTTFTTLGLQKYFIDYFYEFIFVCGSQYDENEIASFLTSFSEYLIEHKKGVLQGDVLSFEFYITSETKMNSLYFTLPFYFDDDLQELKLHDKTIIFPLIIPVYNEEAELIKKKGWNCFEEFLEENEIDNLWDLKRNKYSW